MAEPRKEKLPAARARTERLPPNVSSFVDRHGKRRYRFRSKGRGCYLKAHPNTADGAAEIAAFLAAQGAQPGPALVRWPHGTIGWLAPRFLASPAFAGGKGALHARSSRLILDKFVAEFAADKVADWRFDHVEALLMRTARPSADARGRKRGGPSAASNLRGALLPLFDYAIRLGLIASNPVALSDAPKVPKGGFHAWTEIEIAQYRARHPLGSAARLALEIFLWTWQRRGDASQFGHKHLQNGRFEYVQGKTGKTIWLPAAPQLLAAIAAMPVTGTGSYLVTAYGKPFTRAGLGNKMREWCDQAGLPQCSAHGLRKAGARRAAESGATNQGLKAVGGWSGDREVGLYTASADQARLAATTLNAVIAADLDRGNDAS